MSDRLKRTTKVIKALADEARIRIMNILLHRNKLCVCEINEVIGLSQPTISRRNRKK
jgi:ArsR family transcriptional regulator, arsenate/arsenite/antimonite-responsive transcriptional repressor